MLLIMSLFTTQINFKLLRAKISHLFIYLFFALRGYRHTPLIYDWGYVPRTHLILISNPNLNPYLCASFRTLIICKFTLIRRSFTIHRILTHPFCPLSLANPFKKHLFTFWIFRTVLPTKVNEIHIRQARAPL